MASPGPTWAFQSRINEGCSNSLACAKGSGSLRLDGSRFQGERPADRAWLRRSGAAFMSLAIAAFPRRCDTFIGYGRGT